MNAFFTSKISRAIFMPLQSSWILAYRASIMKMGLLSNKITGLRLWISANFGHVANTKLNQIFNGF